MEKNAIRIADALEAASRRAHAAPAPGAATAAEVLEQTANRRAAAG